MSLTSLARRYLDLHDESADLGDMFQSIVKDLAAKWRAPKLTLPNVSLLEKATRSAKRDIARDVFGIIMRRQKTIPWITDYNEADATEEAALCPNCHKPCKIAPH